MDDSLETVAARHGFGVDAVRSLADALRRGGGRQAQFNHAELGGMGQWSQGGMLMIGAMNDHDLKARVAALAQDLATRADPEPDEPAAWEASGARRDGWSDALGRPSASGSQNGIRYGVFPDMRRLAVERNGQVTWHDTLDHKIGGVSQSQGGGTRLRFSSQHGDIDLESLPVVAVP